MPTPFGWGQIGPGAAKQTHERHCAYFTTFLSEREAHLKGAGQQAALTEIATESDNIRRAWQWAITQRQVEYVEQAIFSLGLFYKWRGRYEEGEAAFRRAATDTRVSIDWHEQRAGLGLI